MDQITTKLVDYSMSVDYARLDAVAIDACKARFLDTMGCAFGAMTEPASVFAQNLATQYSGTLEATVIGAAKRTNPEMAAFANGVMMRFLDMNDMYRDKSGGHPSDIFAAVLAMAEAAHADGRSFMAAAVLAYEIFCSFCESIDINTLGWDQPVYGAIASALACGRLLGLTRSQMGDALALAVVPNMALLQTRRGELSNWKGCAAANGSRNAVFAALLARGGFSGPGDAFEGRDGFFRAVGKFDWAPLDVFASPRRIAATHFKCFALGYHGQAAAWAALDLRERVAPSDIEQLDIRIYRAAVDMMGTDASRWRPQTRETADHSLPYVVATTLIDGAIGEESFADAKLRDPRVLDLMQKTRVIEDPALSALYPEAAPCRITARTQLGTRFEAYVPYPKGHVKNPLAWPEIEQKFRRLSHAHVSESHATAIISGIHKLESVPDMCQLARLFQTQ